MVAAKIADWPKHQTKSTAMSAKFSTHDPGAVVAHGSGKARENKPTTTIREAANMLKISKASVVNARNVRAKTIPEVVTAIEDGQITIHAAKQIAAAPRAEQQASLEKARSNGRKKSSSDPRLAWRDPSLVLTSRAKMPILEGVNTLQKGVIPMKWLAALGLFGAGVIGCAEQHVIKFTDVGSRREYRSIGAPSVLPSGAVSFRDETSGKAVTLQSWEAEDDDGRYYIARWDPVWGGYKLVPGKPTGQRLRNRDVNP
jgi:hypothetical protein